MTSIAGRWKRATLDLRLIDAIEKIGDLLRYPLRRQAQRLIDVNVALRNAARRVTEQCADRHLRKAEITCHAGKRVAQRVRRHALDPRALAKATDNTIGRREVTASAVRWKDMGAFLDDWLIQDKVDRSFSDGASLGIALGVCEIDISSIDVQPIALEHSGLVEAEPSHQDKPRRSDPDRMFAVGLGLPHDHAKSFDLVHAQAAFALLPRQTTNPRGRILLDQADANGMRQQAMECRNGSGGRTRPASRDPATPAPNSLRCSSGSNVSLHLLDIGKPERLHLAPTKQRLDVGLDPASIHAKR